MITWYISSNKANEELKPMTTNKQERLNQRIQNRIQDLHVTIAVLARQYAEARAANDYDEAASTKNNIEILQGLLEAAYAQADEIKE